MKKKKRMNLAIQSKPIYKANEDVDNGVNVPSLFNRMIKKFDNGLPGLDKLKAYGLLSGIPGLKPGLTLAGNMIGQTMMDYE